MKQKAIEAARFLSIVRQECRILNSQNLPLTGKECDAIKAAVECLAEYVQQAEIPAKSE